MNIIDFAAPQMGNFIMRFIAVLIEGTSSIGLGIILFTLILKVITLPFDFASRISMRKNSVKMEMMRPELEKLQKQYAGDKLLYNQKMTALYKKNGYSMFGACLPTILTLVIFIIAINGFTNYSKYANQKYFYEMANSYNNVVYSAFDLDESENKYIVRNDIGEIVFDDQKLVNALGENSSATLTGTNSNGNFNIYLEKTANGYSVFTTNSYIKAERVLKGETYIFENDVVGSIIESKLSSDNPLASKENNYLLVNYKEGSTEENDNVEFSDIIGVEDATSRDFLSNISSQKAAEKYREIDASFLWVKNIWVTDSPFKHPVQAEYTTFKSSFGEVKTKNGGTFLEGDYSKLVNKLNTEKVAKNGYFILVILTVASSFLMQFVSNRSQKAQMELQTVDGQGAATSKMMMWMMPILMAVFAFIYTAAFAIYIVLSSVISLLTTLLINKIVDVKFKKEAVLNGGDGKLRGRIHQEEQPVTKKGKNKKEKAAPKNDFFTGKQTKHVRGRIK